MGDAREGRGKSEYIQWNPKESKMLMELLVDCIKRGLCDTRGRISKRMVETKILPVLNERFKCRKSYKHYQHRMKFLKNQYQSFVNLLCSNPKFAWDPFTKMFTAPEEVWKDYIKIHPNHKYMSRVPFEEYESLQLIFRNGVTRRRNAMKSSDRIDARIHENKDNEQVKEDDDHADDIDEIHESSYHHESQEHRASLLLCANAEDHSEKRVRTDRSYEGTDSTTQNDLLEKVYVELSSISAASKQILSLMQHQEDEKKTNNVWDAIKEIPNLKNYVRYKAITLILKLGMNDIFMNMSIEERLGWIQCNI